MVPAQARTTGVLRPGSRTVRLALAALVVLFLAAHLPWLVSAPTDIDEANFVLGLRDFDVATHQPHPPGYPVFIALGKLSLPVARLWPDAPLVFGGPAAVETRALALWATALGALALGPLFVLFHSLERQPGAALAATFVTAAAPQYWFTAARPLSDVPGLAVIVLVDAWLLAAWRRQRDADPASDDAHQSAGRLVLLAAFVAGLAVGLRSQTMWLTGPLFAFVTLTWRRDPARLFCRSVVLCLVGVAIWAVPLIALSGGVHAYLAALQWQASDDFAGVPMLVSELSVRRAYDVLTNTFVMMWATRDFARLMLGLAAIGLIGLAWRGRAALGLLAVAFLPYAAFHLLFHETALTRYALPLVPAVVYLAVRGLQTLMPRLLPVTAALLTVALLVLTIPHFVRYTTNPTPVFAALGDIERRLATPEYAGAVVAAHQPFRRALQLSGLQPAVMLPTPLLREWLELERYWREGGRGPVLFLQDPRRGSLELVDPVSRGSVIRYQWAFPRQRFVGGIRPDLVNLVTISSPPGWFCGEGWHLTPEALGVARRRGRPDARAYVRRRPEAAIAVVGGAYLGTSDSGPRVVTMTLDDRPIAQWTLSPASPQFFQAIDLPAGSLQGPSRFAEIVLRPEDDGGPGIEFTAFDLQSATELFSVLGPGWFEREYNPSEDRDWRWSSDRATVYVHHAGRDLTLRLAGESPLKYFDGPARVVVRAGDQVLGRLTLSLPSDFVEQLTVPVAALDRSRNLITIETDRTFVPAERGRSGDRRRLGLRIFELALR
jgi:hypothetical protein